jgi:hypothetical protein
MSSLTIDPSYLEDLVLETGGTLHRGDGSVLNASGKPIGYRLPKKKAEPAPVAPVQQDPYKAGNEALVNALADMVSKLHLQQPQAPVVNVPEPSVVIQPASKVSWRFEFERNPDKTIKAIIAKPT